MSQNVTLMSCFLQVYHLCNRHGGGMAFECPRGTRFQQRTMVCDHEHLVQCHNSEQYFHSNLRIGQANLNFIDDRRKSSKFFKILVLTSFPKCLQSFLGVYSLDALIKGFPLLCSQLSSYLPNLLFSPPIKLLEIVIYT